MKLSIMDYHQVVACALQLDMNDLLLLRWFVDFRNTDRMEQVIFENGDEKEVFYWIKYEKVIEDLPILKIKNKDVLRRRFKKLCDAEVLTFKLVKNKNGTFTYYNTGSKYKSLVYNIY